MRLRAHDPMRRRAEHIVRPARHHLADIAHEGIGIGGDVEPVAGTALHLPEIAAVYDFADGLHLHDLWTFDSHA